MERAQGAQPRLGLGRRSRHRAASGSGGLGLRLRRRLRHGLPPRQRRGRYQAWAGLAKGTRMMS
eukprot:3226156-Alexandrium_andersonii.AAC.1